MKNTDKNSKADNVAMFFLNAAKWFAMGVAIGLVIHLMGKI